MEAGNNNPATDAFSRQAIVFDKLYSGNLLSEYMRSKFREELMEHLGPDSNILELNCGTGMDSIYFAEKGFDITATDLADGMLNQLSLKADRLKLDNFHMMKLDFEDLSPLGDRRFSHIYSNFSGMNCSPRLDSILLSFRKYLKPGGKVTLALMPKYCPWEWLMILKGKFSTAFRRFHKNGTNAHIEGLFFKCYYYNPSFVKRLVSKEYKILSAKGICVTVPPPFIEGFVERHPRLFRIKSSLS
jgi:ubiquinone/menaquinone biosynthesis C-methylase UbiE